MVTMSSVKWFFCLLIWCLCKIDQNQSFSQTNSHILSQRHHAARVPQIPPDLYKKSLNRGPDRIFDVNFVSGRRQRVKKRFRRRFRNCGHSPRVNIFRRNGISAFSKVPYGFRDEYFPKHVPSINKLHQMDKNSRIGSLKPYKLNHRKPARYRYLTRAVLPIKTSQNSLITPLAKNYSKFSINAKHKISSKIALTSSTTPKSKVEENRNKTGINLGPLFQVQQNYITNPLPFNNIRYSQPDYSLHGTYQVPTIKTSNKERVVTVTPTSVWVAANVPSSIYQNSTRKLPNNDIHAGIFLQIEKQYRPDKSPNSFKIVNASPATDENKNDQASSPSKSSTDEDGARNSSRISRSRFESLSAVVSSSMFVQD